MWARSSWAFPRVAAAAAVKVIHPEIARDPEPGSFFHHLSTPGCRLPAQLLTHEGFPRRQAFPELNLRARLAPSPAQPRMFTARAITSVAVSSETTDCSVIAIFANRLIGIVSVGLNAVAFVKDR